MSSNYEHLYKAGWDNIPEPKVLPVGHWTLTPIGVFFNAPKEEGKSPRISFKYEAVGPLGDVDPRALKALGENYQFSMNDNIYNGDQFWLGNAKDDRKVVQHIEKHGVRVNGRALLVPADDGTPRVNQEIVKELRASVIDAELAISEYNGEPRNEARNFTPHKKAAKAA